jgi:hypothetical protein
MEWQFRMTIWSSFSFRTSTALRAFPVLELFREGVLEVSREKRAKGGFELLEAYAQGRASIIGPGYWAKPRRSKRNRLTARPTIERSVTRDVLSTPYDRTYQVTMHRLL